MMVTKTLRFDDRVTQVLRGLKWSEDGKKAVITQQLDRPLYVQVNKALETAGGTWNKKVKGHLFEQDPRPMIEGMAETGMATVLVDGFFETPKAVTEFMLDMLPFERGHAILEPSAGLGAIAKVLVQRGARKDDIFCVEQNPFRVQALEAMGYTAQAIDFLAFDEAPRFDRVYMNPPFEKGQDMEHLLHAYGMLRMGGRLACVMSAGIRYNTSAKHEEFRKTIQKLNGKIYDLPKGSFKTSGTNVETVLVVI